MGLSPVKTWGNEVLYPADLNAEFANIYNNASSLISPLSGSLDWDGYAHTLDTAGVTTTQSTAAIGWSFIPGNKSGTPGTTGMVSNWAANTATDSNTAASGTATAWTGHSFQRPTLAASNASVTTTDAATVYIANSPLAGTNETITNAWALWVDAGNVRFDDNIHWLSGTSFKGIFDHANAADRTYTFPDATGNIPTVASQAEANAMTSTTTALSPNLNTIINGTQVNSTSGTSIDFTSIPAGVRRITMKLNGVSTDGTDDWLVQIGDSGGVEATGYLGCGSTIGAAVTATNSTAGLIIDLPASAANVCHGVVRLELIDAATFAWGLYYVLGLSNNNATLLGASTKSLSAELDRVRITTTGGTNAFDAGTINISYER